MSDIEKVKQLRKLTGAGFKDCNAALKESSGNLDKAVEILRIKGIAKASKKMSRTATEGVVVVSGDEKKMSLIEVNCETDFVAKNDDFIKFVQELGELNNNNSSNASELETTTMKNNKTVEESLVALIAKIGEKITIGRRKTLSNDDSRNFAYQHSIIKENVSKLAVIVSLKTNEKSQKIDLFGKQLSMHIAASNPLAIDKDSIDKKIVEKELEIIKAEIINSGKPDAMVEKISKGKLSKFLNDNSLLNQIWIMDPKKKVSDVLKENSLDKPLQVLDFIRYKVGEGI